MGLRVRVRLRVIVRVTVRVTVRVRGETEDEGEVEDGGSNPCYPYTHAPIHPCIPRETSHAAAQYRIHTHAYLSTCASLYSSLHAS